MANKLKWFDTEYCGRPDETVQPVLVNDTLYYTLFDRRGYYYVFPSIYRLYLHLDGENAKYDFTSDNEDEMIKYLAKL